MARGLTRGVEPITGEYNNLGSCVHVAAVQIEAVKKHSFLTAFKRNHACV